jgi:hypothetical protein
MHKQNDIEHEFVCIFFAIICHENLKYCFLFFQNIKINNLISDERKFELLKRKSNDIKRRAKHKGQDD